MSGAHDAARDAAQRLWEAANWDELMRDPPPGLDHYMDDIETVAKYLGVETNDR